MVNSSDEHYEFDTYPSRPQAINLLRAYLHETEKWQAGLGYSKVKISSMVERVGFALGSFVGGLVQGFKRGRKKT